MSTFTLDTSGAVEWPDGEVMRWDRLSPFAQGYVEAMFASLRGDETAAVTAALAEIRDRDRRARNSPLLSGCKKALHERCHWSGSHEWPSTCDKLRAVGLVIVVSHGTSLTNGPVSDPTDLGRDVLPFLLAFSDLAPETLARVLKDCANALKMKSYGWSDSADDGRAFYDQRQAGVWRSGSYYEFQPLTPYLGDDGRVYLREGA